MKQNNILTGIISLAFFTVSAFSAQGQAFHKGSFDINLSEGSSYATYTTTDIYTNNKVAVEHFKGDRDPIQLEYGLSSHWGIGLSVGEDFYSINPSVFYGFEAEGKNVKTMSSEFTIDGSYHFYETEKTDLAAVVSLGTSSVTMKGNISDYSYQYTANGGIIRLGVHGRFFVFKHFGLLAMVSTYSLTDSPKGVKGNTVANSYSTTIGGLSVEGGICYRFKK